jgi:protein TonB
MFQFQKHNRDVFVIKIATKIVPFLFRKIYGILCFLASIKCKAILKTLKNRTMKSKMIPDMPVTFEDIVFENRNKEYGAYLLHKRKRKYLLTAFLISLVFFSTAVAVPFINTFKNGGKGLFIDSGTTVILSDFKKESNSTPPPPPPLPPISIEKQAVYAPPVVVEEPTGGDELASIGDIMEEVKNMPVPEQLTTVVPTPEEIDEVDPPAKLFPEEQARFNNGDLNEFRKWVHENVIYPPKAIEFGLFGKVIIEFCVNSRGEVVDVKIIRGVDPSIDNEIIKVISASPLWNPAKQGGRPVKQRFIIPVIFKMEK